MAKNIVSAKNKEIVDYVAEGLTYQEAYNKAGLKSTNRNSIDVTVNKILKKPDVKAYLEKKKAAIEASLIKRKVVTKELLADKLAKIYEMGLERYDLTNCNKSIEILAKIFNLYETEQKDTNQYNLQFIQQHFPPIEKK